jgi:hypothetical protein
MSDPPALERHLALLVQRNEELAHRREKLRNLSQDIQENIHKIQQTYDSVLSMHENTCVDMAAFDKEIRSLTNSLFPAPSSLRPRQTRPRSGPLLHQVASLQRLDTEQCDQRLQEMDPLIGRLRHDVDAIHAFAATYKSFL